MKFLILCALLATAVAAPQRAGEASYGQYRGVLGVAGVQYRPRVVPVQQYRAVNVVSDGQYRPENEDDGQYHPDHSGDYHGDGSGGYSGDNSGGYVNQGEGASVYRYQGGSAGQVYRPVVQTVQPTVRYPSVQQPSVNVRYQGAQGAQGVQHLRPVVESRSGVQSGQYNGNFRIIRQSEEYLEDGYHYEYETENGIIVEEEGHLVEKGTENEHMSVRGFYRYPGPDGVTYTVEYTSDAPNGFVPKGAHLPVAPEGAQRVANKK